MSEKVAEETSNSTPTMGIIEAQKDVKLFRMALSALIAVLPAFSVGMVMSFAAPALIVYKDPIRSPLAEPLTEEEGSWFMSIAFIANITGLLMSGYLAEVLGRKRTLFLSSCIMLVGWILIYFAHTLSALLVSRFIGGAGMGLSILCGIMMLSEIALVRLRGALGVCSTLAINIATLCSYSSAAFVPFEYFIELSALPPILFLILSQFLPESPLWLVKQGREAEARAALVCLRGRKYPVEIELKELINLAAAQGEEQPKLKEQAAILLTKPILEPIFLLGSLFFLQAMVGTDCIQYYSLDIFQKANISVDKYLLAVILQGSWTLGYALASVGMARFGRRKQFLYSGMMLAPCLALLGVSVYFQTHNFDFPLLQYSSPVLIVSSCFCYSLGFGPVVFGLVGELFRPRVKGPSSAIALCTRYFGVFLSLKLFPTLYTFIGLPGIFWLDASTALLACVIVYVFLPETQGLTLTELSAIFGKTEVSRKIIEAATVTFGIVVDKNYNEMDNKRGRKL